MATSQRPSCWRRKTSALVPAISSGWPSGVLPRKVQRLTTSAVSPASSTLTFSPSMRGSSAANCASAPRIASPPRTISSGRTAKVASSSYRASAPSTSPADRRSPSSCTTPYGSTVPPSEGRDRAQPSLDIAGLARREPLLHPRRQRTHHRVGHRLQALCARGKRNARRPAVVRVRLPAHEPVALHEPHHGRQRLLGQAGSTCELPHPKPVLLPQGQQERSVRRPHVPVPALLERLAEQLVPALRGLGEQEPEVAGGGGAVHVVRYRTNSWANDPRGGRCGRWGDASRVNGLRLRGRAGAAARDVSHRRSDIATKGAPRPLGSTPLRPPRARPPPRPR